MKFKLLFISLITLALTSCIKDEPLYREADIEALTLPENVFVRATIGDSQIEIILKSGADLSSLAPELRLSPGATSVPASGETVDFTKNVTYTVTSEDGKYKKDYKVNVDYPQSELKYDFEEWGTGGSGNLTYPQLSNLLWTSANSGVAVALNGNVEEYPTVPTTDAYSGKYAAKLETKKGANFSIIGLYIPVFPGSFFTGKFELKLSNPLLSTKFGQILPQENGKPVSFNGYYKYKPGAKFINQDGDVPGRIDECSIYAVIYRITKGNAEETLDGTNILTDEKVIATAVWGDSSEKSEYTRFSVPFTYTKPLDFSAYDYKLALVFSSSKDGDRYAGAIGSTLIVDDVEVVCEQLD